MEQIRQFKKIVFGLVCAIWIYSIFCVPVKATSIAEQIRNGQLHIEETRISNNLGYAGLESYDSRKYYDNGVLKQGYTDTCWAQAYTYAYGMLLDKKYNERYMLSVRHMALRIYGTLSQRKWK